MGTLQAPRGRRLLLGAVLALMTGTAFGTAGTFGKALIQAGWSPATTVTLRISVGALLLLGPTLISLRGRWHLLRPNLRIILVYGVVAVCGAQLGFFQAVEHLSVGVALLIEYLGLLLVVGWMWIAHGRRPSRLTGSGIVVAVIGLLGVLDVFSGLRISGIGVLWALLAATGLAVFFIVSSTSHHEALPPVALAGLGLTVGAVTLWLSLAVGLLPWRTGAASGVFRGVELPWWVFVAVLGLVSCALAYVLGILAARVLGATLATFFGLSEVLFAIGFAWLLLGEQPNLLQALGGLGVIAGIVLVQLGEPKAAGTDAAGEELLVVAPGPEVVEQPRLDRAVQQV